MVAEPQIFERAPLGVQVAAGDAAAPNGNNAVSVIPTNAYRIRDVEAAAAEVGISTLTDRHWLVIDFMRETYLRTTAAPTIRTLGRESGVLIKELYELFPKGPAKLGAKIGGIPKPKGCI